MHASPGPSLRPCHIVGAMHRDVYGGSHAEREGPVKLGSLHTSTCIFCSPDPQKSIDVYMSAAECKGMDLDDLWSDWDLLVACVT